jgi:hypothetical protein
MEQIVYQKHTVLPHGGQFLVVYPTPGVESVPTVALICVTQQQADEQAARLNGVQA